MSQNRKMIKTQAFPFAQTKTLTLDALIQEALIAGMRLDECYQSTWGEVIDYVNAYRERKRREYQKLSLIAKGQAAMTAFYFSGKSGDAEIYDFFPFWTQDEINELMLEKYKLMLLRNSTQGGDTLDG